jgi:hypothetical protein
MQSSKSLLYIALVFLLVIIVGFICSSNSGKNKEVFIGSLTQKHIAEMPKKILKLQHPGTCSGKCLFRKLFN